MLGRYRAEAIRLVDENGFIRPEHIPELNAREAALRRRLGWDADRLAVAYEGIEGWLFVFWREVEQELSRLVKRIPREVDREQVIIFSWERLRDRGLGSGASAEDTMRWAANLFREIGWVPAEVQKAQLSGLAHFLLIREPILQHAVEVQQQLDVYEPLLNAALDGRKPLSAEALRNLEPTTQNEEGYPTNEAVVADNALFMAYVVDYRDDMDESWSRSYSGARRELRAPEGKPITEDSFMTLKDRPEGKERIARARERWGVGERKRVRKPRSRF